MRFSLSSVITWLRAGYPHGVPREDYIALLGVLQRHLTEDEIHYLVRRLREAHADGSTIDDAEITASIARTLHGKPSPDDVRRVATHLAAGGWPLAGDAEADADPATELADRLAEGPPPPTTGEPTPLPDRAPPVAPAQAAPVEGRAGS